MQEQNPIVLMNFSGIYREEEFWKNRQVSWIELQDVCGTNCYCDEEAIAEINKRTENLLLPHVTFLVWKYRILMKRNLRSLMVKLFVKQQTWCLSWLM